MKGSKLLDERELIILRAVVDLYVRDGAPVGSRQIKDSTGLPVSTATIRNCLARLEHLGLLAKPHISAGRVPTDEGYRIYVDQLDNQLHYGETFSSLLRQELRETSLDMSAIMSSASKALGELSKNVAVVYGSVVQESSVRRIQLLKLEGDRLLVVVTLSPERETTVVIRLAMQYSGDVIRRVENWINDAVADKSISAAKDALDAEIRDNITDEGVIAREVSAHREAIFSEPPALELYFEERGHLMTQPELSDPKLLHLLLGLLHNKTYLTQVLATRRRECTQITIGHEHEDDQLRPFSLVTAGYRLGAARGVLGIMGPTRMRYDVVRALVVTAARELQAIGEEYL